MGLEQARGPGATARTDLGTWEVAALDIFTFGKFPLVKIPLGSCHLNK